MKESSTTHRRTGNRCFQLVKTKRNDDSNEMIAVLVLLLLQSVCAGSRNQVDIIGRMRSGSCQRRGANQPAAFQCSLKLIPNRAIFLEKHCTRCEVQSFWQLFSQNIHHNHNTDTADTININIHQFFFLPSQSTATNPTPLPNTNSPYVILGLHDPYASNSSTNDTRDVFPSIAEIKRAYHRLVPLYHPDSFHKRRECLQLTLDASALSERGANFERINEAYNILMVSAGKHDYRQPKKKATAVRASTQRHHAKSTQKSLCTDIVHYGDVLFPWKAWSHLNGDELVLIPSQDYHGIVEAAPNNLYPAELLHRVLTEERDEKPKKELTTDSSILQVIMRQVEKRRMAP